MKSHPTKAGALTLIGAFCAALQLLAAKPQGVEQVLLREDKLLVVFKGATNVLEEEVSLPNEITVLTNAAFRVGEGRERPLREGQVLLANGMLLSPTGSLLPVFDNIMMRRGKPMLTQDGNTSVLQSTFSLGNGAKITADGNLITPAGSQKPLLDGQIFKLDGTPVQAWDTVTVLNGQAVIQADGSLLTIPRGRSFMMNDGTKVFGEGKVVLKDGKTRPLTEGEVLIIPGVVTKHYGSGRAY